MALGSSGIDGGNLILPVVHLEDANFKVVDISIKTEPIDILNHCKGRYFGHYSHFKSLKRLGIVSPNHKLVA